MSLVALLSVVAVSPCLFASEAVPADAGVPPVTAAPIVPVTGGDAGVAADAAPGLSAPALTPPQALPAPPAAALAVPSPDLAGPDDDSFLRLPPLQIHAFASQGYLKSTGNNYLAESKHGSFDFTEVGINFTQLLTERVRTGVQLFARQLGRVGDYRPRVDWFYIDYRFADWLGIRAGRTKVPFGLYNEVGDVDAARIPILLPQATYPILNREMLLAQTGLEAYGYIRLGELRALEYRLYGGTLFVDQPPPPFGLTGVRVQVPYIIGGRLFWETPLDGLRVGGNVQTLKLDTRFGLPPVMNMPPGHFDINFTFVLWLASLEYSANDLLVAAEFGRWSADVDSTGQPRTKVTNERFYWLVAYRLAPWFTPAVYYSVLVPDVNKRDGRENYQRDLSLTLRFDVNPFLLIKLEGHYMNGTTDLAPDLNDGTPKNQLTKDWFFFLVKTTAYF